MDISFDYYKIFYEVANAKNISLAAQHLCLTQPTVTKYIQNLEQELQCKLFLRSRKGVTLTAEGQMLLRQVSRAVQQMDRAGGMLQEFVNCQSGKINIGASELTMRYYLLPYLGTVPPAVSQCQYADSLLLHTRLRICTECRNRRLHRLHYAH